MGYMAKKLIAYDFKAWRSEMGLKRAAAARELQVDRHTLENWEKNGKGDANAIRVCKMLALLDSRRGKGV